MVRNMFAVKRAAAPSTARADIWSSGKPVRACVRRDGERGTATVEFALVVPIFLIVLMGMFSMAGFLNKYLQLTDAVEIGARSMAVMRGVTADTDPCALAATAIQNAAPQLTAASMTYTFVITSGSAASPTTNTYSTATCTAGAAELTQGLPVTVTVNYPCSILSMSFGPLYNFNIVPSCNLQAKITEISQ
jgi:Flp pilus assembly protein TadG